MKSYGAAKLVCPNKIFDMLKLFVGEKTGLDFVLTTSSSENKLTYLCKDLEMLGYYFGQCLIVTPTHNQKQIATAICKSGSEVDVRAAAKHMTHSIGVHRVTYQQKGSINEAINSYTPNNA